MKKYDLVAVVGKYTNAQGEEKKNYRNVGAIIQTQHGFSMKLDATFNPAGLDKNEDGSVWISMFEPKERQQAPQQQQFAGNPQQPQGMPQVPPPSNPQPAFDDSADIPF